MSRNRLRNAALAIGTLALAATLAAPARASQSYSFTQITTNENLGTAGQYTVTVYGQGDNPVTVGSNSITIGANQALFVFTNTAAIDSSITDVYFQDGTLLNIATVYNTSGTNFANPANPNNLPGGNTLTPVAFRTTQQFSADASSAPNGVDQSTESVGILFNLKVDPNSSTGDKYTYADVITALTNGINSPTAVWNSNGTDKAGGDLGLRVGIHVSSIGPNSISDSFVTTNLTAVPEPATTGIALSGLAAFGLFGLRRRARKVQATA